MTKEIIEARRVAAQTLVSDCDVKLAEVESLTQ